MTYSKTDKFIIDYCQKHNIKLKFDPSVEKDNGFCYPDENEILLSTKYSSQKIKMAVFFHEISHINVERLKNKPYNSFECEMLAWALAMKKYKRMFNKSFTKSQATFMLDCLQTYCKSQYEFKKFKDEEFEIEV